MSNRSVSGASSVLGFAWGADTNAGSREVEGSVWHGVARSFSVLDADRVVDAEGVDAEGVDAEGNDAEGNDAGVDAEGVDAGVDAGLRWSVFFGCSTLRPMLKFFETELALVKMSVLLSDADASKCFTGICNARGISGKFKACDGKCEVGGVKFDEEPVG